MESSWNSYPKVCSLGNPRVFLCKDGKGNRWYQDQDGYYIEPETLEEMIAILKELEGAE